MPSENISEISMKKKVLIQIYVSKEASSEKPKRKVKFYVYTSLNDIKLEYKYTYLPYL